MAEFHPLDSPQSSLGGSRGTGDFSSAAGPSNAPAPYRDDNPFLSPSRTPQRRRRAVSASHEADSEMGLDAAPYDFDMLGGAEKDKVPPIEALQRAWVSERAAPELLRWEERGVDEVCAQIEDQAAILDSLSADADTSAEEHVRLGIVALEIERARWLLRAYMRVRIDKIERYAAHISSSWSTQSRMSELEKGYATRFYAQQSSYLRSAVLDFLPEHMRGLEDEGQAGASGGMVVAPDLDSPVFVRCREDCGPLRIADGEDANMSEGSIHLLRYRNARALIAQGRVELL